MTWKEWYQKYTDEVNGEIKPLVDELSKLNQLETDRFKITIVDKEPFNHVPSLYHDWLKITDGCTLMQAKLKVDGFVCDSLKANHLHHDTREHLAYINKQFLKVNEVQPNG